MDISDMSLPSDHSVGHNSQDNTLQGRPRHWDMHQKRYNYGSEKVSFGTHPSSHQQQNGDSAASGAHVATRVRFDPYAFPRYHRRGNFKKRDQTHANMKEKQQCPERVKEKKWDETSGSWFKITIPFGIRYDEKWLLNLIQTQCSVPFTPVEFHYEKMQAQFFIENASTAFALKDVNGKIWNKENEKIFIIVNPSDVPLSVQKEVKSEKAEQVKLTVKKQYGVSQDSLDIQRPRFEPDLMTHDTETALNPRISLAASLQINEVNVPKLLPFNQSNKKPYQLDGLSNTMQNACNIKNLNSDNEVNSTGQLVKGKGLEQEEMSANRNPLCTTIPDKSTNISSILELFPKLLRMDGQEQSPPTNLGIEVHKKLPTCQGSFFGSDVLKSLVLQFLQQYYLIYDCGDRQGLLRAYHDEACFSLTISFNPEAPDLSTLFDYFKDNRNMKILKDPYLRVQLLKRTKCDIVWSLCALPKTQHDPHSFLVDMWFQTETMVCFSVNGVFMEVEGMCQGSVRAFTRNFIAVPASNSGISIVNDELFVRDITPSKTQSVFSMQVTTPISSSGPTPSSSRKWCRFPRPNLG